MSLVGDLKQVFKNNRHTAFTRSDLYWILIDCYGYSRNLKIKRISKELRKLKESGHVDTYGRKWEMKGDWDI